MRREKWLSTPSGIAAENGEDWATLVDQGVRDNERLIMACIEGADRINQAHPKLEPKPNWTTLLNLPIGASYSVNISTEDGPLGSGSQQKSETVS